MPTISALVIPPINPEVLTTPTVGEDLRYEYCTLFNAQIFCGSCLYSVANLKTFKKVANKYWRKL